VKIGAIHRRALGAKVRISADVAWENSGRRPVELFFETDARFESDFQANAEAFAAACVVPAMRHGEERLHVEGALCPRLVEGLETSTALLRKWYGAPRRQVRIEATGGFVASVPRVPARAAACLTGGVDSLHLFISNRRRFPAGHPGSFVDALAISGLLVAGAVESDRVRDHFSRTCLTLAKTTEELGLTLVPVTTNVRDLDPDIAFFEEEFAAAAVCSIAHLFARRWTSLSLASAARGAGEAILRGTHELLDPGYGSAAVEIQHVMSRGGRLNRVRELASWGASVEDVVVCLQSPESPPLNCGRCEKCTRTMVELLTVHRLARTRQFPSTDVTVERIRSLRLSMRVEEYWTDVLGPLEAMGRGDLAAAIRAKLRGARLKEALKSADRALADGAVARAWRSWRHRAAGGKAAP
jgi:hypothetical protein